MSTRAWVGAAVLVLAGGCAARPGVAESGESGEASESASSSDTTTGEPSTETSSTSETETGATETGATETETGADETSESETGEPVPPCEGDEDCSPGNCIEGECVVCQEDWECTGPWEFCMERVCNAGTCELGPKDCTVSGCHVGYCDEGPFGGHICEIELCEEYDGVVDIEINMVAVDWTPPSELDLDQSVRVLKENEPVCSVLEVVRALDGPLLLAHSWNGTPDHPSWSNRMLDKFGADWATLSAPLTTQYYDPELCPVVFDGCSNVTRGIAQVEANGELAKIADSQVGWAPGGYFVNASDMNFRDEYCIQLFGAWTVSASIMRDACTDDCPPPTVHEGCFPELDEPHPAGFWIDILLEHWDYVYADFECVVIETSVGVDEQGNPLHTRGLDCVPLLQPTEHPECGH